MDNRGREKDRDMDGTEVMERYTYTEKSKREEGRELVSATHTFTH